MNLIDRAVAFFDPLAGAQRMVARVALHNFGYNDVPSRRSSSGGMYANAGGESYAKGRDRIKAMWDARDLAMYSFLGGVLARVVLYVVGQLHCKSTTGDEQIDAMYDADFHGWCGDEPDENGFVRCDITGRHRFIKLVQMAFLGMLVDGDYGLVEIDPREAPGQEYCLQPVEADRIGNPIEQQIQENYVAGVMIDPGTGRLAGYRIFQRTRTNQYIKPQERPPNAFIHVIDPDRADQYRGRTILLRLLNDVRDIQEIIEAEKMACKIQSQYAALVGLKDPFSKDGPGAWDSKTPSGTPSQKAEFGKILKMAEGETFSMLAPADRPSGAFLNFMQVLIRKAAVSLDLPYGFVWDLATLGGVTARIEVQQALRRIQYWQQNIIVNKICNRVRTNYIASRIAIGALPPTPNWKSCEWHFGPWIITDAGYEMSNDISAVQAGILPVSQITGKYGLSPQEVFQSNASTANTAVNVGAESNMPVEVWAKGLYPDITEQRAAMLQGTPPPPPAGSLEAIGEKSAKELIGVLESVSTGKMDRESAVQALVTVYGLAPEQADQLVPKEAIEQPTQEAPAGKPSKPTKTSRFQALINKTNRIITFEE